MSGMAVSRWGKSVVILFLCALLCAQAAYARSGGGENADAADAGLLSPGCLRYLGAFRLPEDGADEAHSFSYSGEAMAYSPTGAGGAGSLFVTGHNWHTHVAEISVPPPLRSSDAGSLPASEVIQPLTDIRGRLYERWTLEIPRVGLETIGDRLCFCWGEHMQFETGWGTHGSRSLDLSLPAEGAACLVGGEEYNYATNDYLFAIPPDWAQRNAPGFDLATGRFRDGGWGGMGPSLFAISSAGLRAAAMDERVHALPLILYDSSYGGDAVAKLYGYSHADSWTGGAWITSPAGSAVVFAGTHGFGKTWYGFANGVEFPTDGDANEAYPDVPEAPYDQRGWWNDDFRACLLLYDPGLLALSAQGALEASAAQPYAMVDLSGYMIGAHGQTCMQHLGAVACDCAGGRLFIQELFADGDKPVVHVFQASP